MMPMCWLDTHPRPTRSIFRSFAVERVATRIFLFFADNLTRFPFLAVRLASDLFAWLLSSWKGNLEDEPLSLLAPRRVNYLSRMVSI